MDLKKLERDYKRSPAYVRDCEKELNKAERSYERLRVVCDRELDKQDKVVNKARQKYQEALNERG